MQINNIKDFGVYFNFVSAYRIQLQGILGKQGHISQLTQVHIDIMKEKASLEHLQEIQRLSKEYKISEDSIYEIFFLGRYIEKLVRSKKMISKFDR